METKTKSLKNDFLKLTKVLVIGMLMCSGIKTKAQTPTGTYTVLQQPCNNNGELTVTITSGMTPPIDYYYDDINGNSYSHLNINSLTDTLFGISALIYYIQATPTLIPWSVYYSSTITGMVLPFTVDSAIITNAICPSLTGSAQITINGGTMPASVQWFNNLGSTLGSYVGTGDPMTLPPGSYGTIVTNAIGCTVSFIPTDSSSGSPGPPRGIIINNISGINFSVPTTNASCTNGTASVIGLTGGTAPYTYLWSNGATSSSISGLSQGSYSVTITDAIGCHNDSSKYISQSIVINVNPVATSATCLSNDGSIISFGSGGTPPYTYLYSNGMTGQSITGISGGTNLNVTATDTNGCTGIGYAYVNTSTPITVTYVSLPSSCTAATGSTTLTITGGTGPYIVNWSTSPALSGITISSMAAGNYNFTVTDAVGCIQTGTAVIPPVSTIIASWYSANPVCPATTGTVSVTVTGSNPPFTYLWNTGAVTSSLSAAPIGSYSCVITDNLGCTQTKFPYLYTTSPITLGFSTTQASCLYTADGSILANVIGGVPPYTYAWSNGQTTPSATSLATGNYWLTVTDANGCTENNYGNYVFVGYDSMNTSCYCTVRGKVFDDLNGNCIMDAGENGIDHIMMHCSGFGYTFTDVNGYYSFPVPTGTYTLSESVQYAYPLAACQSNAVPVTVAAATGCTDTVNFANNINVIHDLHIVTTSIDNAIPGNTYTRGMIVENDGTVNESTIQLGHTSDGQLNFVSASPALYTQLSPVAEPNWYSVTSGFPALAPGASTMVYFNDLVPTNIPLATIVLFGDTISYAAPMSNWLIDYTPSNNVQAFQTTIIGSYDPNFKEVSPKGYGVQGFIQPSNSAMDYVVHFQNTGSYYADKVVVVDTLDSDLDLQSLRVGYSDHAYTATVSESGILKFTFNHIHLDPETYSDLSSRGLVSYSIKQNPHLAPGTEIKNRAAIYFDYNAPVFTNQTLNTIQIGAGISENSNKGSLNIYPNPATDELNIKLNNLGDVALINIYDLQGRLIQSEKAIKNESNQKISITNLVSGLYFISLEKSNGQKTTGKFIKN